MVELLGYLEANGFSNYIASGGGRDFMRPISREMYGIPRERVIGSASTLEYVSDVRGGTITHKPEADYLVLSDVLCEVGVTDSALGAGKGRRDQAEVRDEGGWVGWVRPCREFR